VAAAAVAVGESLTLEGDIKYPPASGDKLVGKRDGRCRKLAIIEANEPELTIVDTNCRARRTFANHVYSSSYMVTGGHQESKQTSWPRSTRAPWTPNVRESVAAAQCSDHELRFTTTRSTSFTYCMHTQANCWQSHVNPRLWNKSIKDPVELNTVGKHVGKVEADDFTTVEISSVRVPECPPIAYILTEWLEAGKGRSAWVDHSWCEPYGFRTSTS